MSIDSPHQWMRVALTEMFDTCTTAELKQALTDTETLEKLRERLARSMNQADSLRIPAGDRGNNLLQGLISLRLKFDREEAFAKLEKNIGFREASPEENH